MAVQKPDDSPGTQKDLVLGKQILAMIVMAMALFLAFGVGVAAIIVVSLLILR